MVEADQMENKQIIRSEIIRKIKSGDFDGIEYYLNALNGQIIVCRNFKDLLLSSKYGREFSNQKYPSGVLGGPFSWDYEYGVQWALDEYSHAMHGKWIFKWMPDEGGKGWEKHLAGLIQLYNEAGEEDIPNEF
jgi:hypothetical protein